MPSFLTSDSHTEVEKMMESQGSIVLAGIAISFGLLLSWDCWGFHSLHHGHLEPQVLQLPIPHHYLAFQSIIFLKVAVKLGELSIRTSRISVYSGSRPLLLLTLLLLPDVTEIT
jgi:hypothetical protein